MATDSPETAPAPYAEFLDHVKQLTYLNDAGGVLVPAQHPAGVVQIRQLLYVVKKLGVRCGSRLR